MKTRILATIALAMALPVVAQANSVVTEQTFAQQRETLNAQATSDYRVLPTSYRIDTVSGGHSAAADQSLAYVAAATQRATHVPAGDTSRVGDGQSDAAAQALQNVSGGAPQSHGSVEMSFASLN